MVAILPVTSASEQSAAAPERRAPAPLPTAAEVPPQLCFREVVPHPAGGWTIAQPVDATRSTRRIYRGRWAKHADALEALEVLV